MREKAEEKRRVHFYLTVLIFLIIAFLIIVFLGTGSPPAPHLKGVGRIRTSPAHA
jgi:hypothetical protein